MLNLTPHAIVVLSQDGETEVAVFQPSGIVARLATEYASAQDYMGIPVSITKVVDTIHVPEANEMYPFLVSSMVLDSLPAKYHGIAFAPDTGASAIRNVGGHIIGVTRLRTVPNK